MTTTYNNDILKEIVKNLLKDEIFVLNRVHHSYVALWLTSSLSIGQSKKVASYVNILYYNTGCIDMIFFKINQLLSR